MIPEINSYKCNGCGQCVKQCPAQVMGMINKKAVIVRDMCEECGTCAFICPIEAVYIEMPFWADSQTTRARRRVISLITNVGV